MICGHVWEPAQCSAVWGVMNSEAPQMSCLSRFPACAAARLGPTQGSRDCVVLMTVFCDAHSCYVESLQFFVPSPLFVYSGISLWWCGLTAICFILWVLTNIIIMLLRFSLFGNWEPFESALWVVSLWHSIATAWTRFIFSVSPFQLQSQPFLQGALVPLTWEWYWETNTWGPGVLIAAECCCFSGHLWWWTERGDICVYIIHVHSLLYSSCPLLKYTWAHMDIRLCTHICVSVPVTCVYIL